MTAFLGFQVDNTQHGTITMMQPVLIQEILHLLDLRGKIVQTHVLRRIQDNRLILKPDGT